MLTASYTDKGSGTVAAITSTEQFIFKSSILEAEEADEMHQSHSKWSAQGANIIGEIKEGSFMIFNEVLLDDLKSISFRGLYNENYQYTGKVEIRLGAKDGKLLGEANLDTFNKTKQLFKTTDIALGKTTGKGKLFILFKNADNAETLITNADYFLLNY
jgi:cytochrome c